MIRGHVLSIGSGSDDDGMGGKYRDYFSRCESYARSEVSGDFGTHLVLDVIDMRSIGNATCDYVYCSGVLDEAFRIHGIEAIDARPVDFPAARWARAEKKSLESPVRE